MEKVVKAEIISRVNAILVDKLGCSEEMIKSDAQLGNDLGADSLDAVEIIMECEREFQITILDSEAEGLKTCEDVYCMVDKIVNAEEATPSTAPAE